MPPLNPKFGTCPLCDGNAVKATHQLKVSGRGPGQSCQLRGCRWSCTRSIAEEFGHGESVIWTYLPSGPPNPALHLLLNALGTLLLDKQTLDTLVTASNLITSVILWISWGHGSLIDWYYVSALSAQLTLPMQSDQTVQAKQIRRLGSLSVDVHKNKSALFPGPEPHQRLPFENEIWFFRDHFLELQICCASRELKILQRERRNGLFLILTVTFRRQWPNSNTTTTTTETLL